MRLGLAQINSTVGDLAGNRRKILDAYGPWSARARNSSSFPEMIVSGYPPRDLLFKRRFVPDVEESLRQIAAEVGEVPALIGTVEANSDRPGQALLQRGRVLPQGRDRRHGPEVPAADLRRLRRGPVFRAGAPAHRVSHAGRRIGVTICEDIWTHPMISTRRLYHGLDPVKQLVAQRCDLMVNISASPWHNEKGDVRQTLVTDAAFELDCPVVYVNAVGGNDELIFDGRSLVSDASGHVFAGLAPSPRS